MAAKSGRRRRRRGQEAAQVDGLRNSSSVGRRASCGVDLRQPVGVRGVNPVVRPALDPQVEQDPDGEVQQGAAALVRHECGIVRVPARDADLLGNFGGV